MRTAERRGDAVGAGKGKPTSWADGSRGDGVTTLVPPDIGTIAAQPAIAEAVARRRTGADVGAGHGLPPGPLYDIEPAALGAVGALKVSVGMLRLVRAVDGSAPESRIVDIGGHFGPSRTPETLRSRGDQRGVVQPVRQLADRLRTARCDLNLVAHGPLGHATAAPHVAATRRKRGGAWDGFVDEYGRTTADPAGLTTTDESAGRGAPASRRKPRAARATWR